MADLMLLTHRLPYPPNKGDKIRSYHLLRYLCRHFRVHLGCFVDDAADNAHLGHVAAMCQSSTMIPMHRGRARLRGLQGLLTGQAMSLPFYRSAAMQSWVDGLLGNGGISHALAFSGPMAQYLMQPPACAVDLCRLVDLVDVDSEKWLQYAATRHWPLSALYRREARRLLAYERGVAAAVDAVTFVSAAEAALFRRRAPESGPGVSHFNNGVDADYFSPRHGYADPYPAGGAVLVFTGAMDYWPNVQAVSWFAAEVMPALRSRHPQLRFYIVGGKPARQVLELAALPGVTVTGAVADVRPYLAHAAAAVAPLRIARGVQNKVLEAMAMQKTVVCSPEALEGIDALDGREVLVAAGAGAFIVHLSALLRGAGDPALGLAARQRVLAGHGWEPNLERLGLLLSLARPHSATRVAESTA